MTFLAPSRLWLLAVVAGLAVAYIVLQRRRRHYAVRFTNLDLLSSVAPKRPGWRRHVSAALLALGLVAMVLALARPVRQEQVAKEQATLMLVVDVSASMESTDVSPTRLQAAVAAAEKFVAEVPAGFDVGLVAFDRTPSVLASPSTDRGELLAALSTLTTGPGTATGDAINVALQAINAHDATTGMTGGTGTGTGAAATGGSAEPTAAIVLLSDGKSTVGSDVLAAAQAAADQGVAVNTIAYGTEDGTVDVAGQTVAVPADTATMQQVASATGGSSFSASSQAQLSKVYDRIQERIGYTNEPHEILRAFVAIGIVALLLGLVASLAWGGRIL